MVSYDTQILKQLCPYCGEPIELVVDLSVAEQEHVEDCFVCCRPIVVTLMLETDGVGLTLRTEDQA